MNKEFVKDSLNEISAHEIDILSYLVNNFMTKKDLYYSKCSLMNENTNLKQALNEIRNILSKYKEHCEYVIFSEMTQKCLQIIDKILGDEK